MQQIAEKIVESLDAPLTASSSNQDLARVIWVFSRTQPNIRISWLRAKTYKAVAKKLKKAGQRVKGQNPEKFDALLREFTADFSSDNIQALAAREGFQESWFDPTTKGAPQKAAAVHAAEGSCTSAGVPS